MIERITLFGDISSIHSTDIRSFVKATGHHQFGGSFPLRESEVPDAEIIARNCHILAQAGIIDLPPIVPCNSIQDRAEAILRFCQQHRTQNDKGQYWVLETQPDAFAAAIREVVNSDKAILQSITVINLGSPRGYDYRDPITGVRVGALTFPLTPYPMHPAPAFLSYSE